MPLRRQTEAARGGKVQRTRVARDFSDNEGEITTAHTFFQCEQRIFGPVCLHMNHPVADIGGQPGAIGPAIGADGRTVLHPQYRTLVVMCGGSRQLLPLPPLIKRQSERAGRAGTVTSGGKYFVMIRACQSRAPMRRVLSIYQSRPPFQGGRGSFG